MPDRRRHRGPAPEDSRAFREEKLPDLRVATADLSWLLTRGYPEAAALKLVGDRFRLTQRQRKAVSSVAASEDDVRSRLSRRRRLEELRGEWIEIDGYNILTTLETALSGGVVLVTRDGSHRDLASVHGTYRQVEETRPALELLGGALAQASVEACHWLIDRPVSNSGRLKQTIQSIAEENEWPWSVDVVRDPDPVLAASRHVVATADRVILDQCRAWVDLVGPLLPETAWRVDLRRGSEGSAERSNAEARRSQRQME